jgi:hypothetical protein
MQRQILVNISVDFGLRFQLQSLYLAFVKYLRKMGIKLDIAPTIGVLEESL